MNGSCSKCGVELEPRWKFCPYCGSAGVQEASAQAVPPTHEKAPVRAAFSGLLFGVLAAPVLILVGGMLCLTGLGAIGGIPLIVAGVLAPLIGPLLGVNALRGKCPWCGAGVSGVGIFDRFSCPTCGKHIAVRKREMLRVE